MEQPGRSGLRFVAVCHCQLLGLENLKLIFEGGTADWSTFEVAGEDKGLVPEGFDLNFGLGHLRVGGADAALLRLDDLFDNGNRSSPEALYVHDLTVGPGSTLDMNGLNLYYDGRFVNQGQVIGGTPIPEPATLVLLGEAVPLVLKRKRKSR